MQRFPIFGSQSSEVTFAVTVPPDAASGRHVLCADVTLGPRRFGWLPEAILDVTTPDRGAGDQVTGIRS